MSLRLTVTVTREIGSQQQSRSISELFFEGEDFDRNEFVLLHSMIEQAVHAIAGEDVIVGFKWKDFIVETKL